MSKSLSLEWVLSLDLKSFGSLLKSVRRNEAETRAADAWTIFVGAQATKEGVTSYCKQLTRGSDENDSEAFARKHETKG